MPAQEPEPSVTPYQVAKAAAVILGDQWGVRPGAMGTTGHLHNADWTPFTVGVCEAGHLYVRNDEIGDSAHLPVATTTADVDTLARAVVDVLGSLF